MKAFLSILFFLLISVCAWGQNVGKAGYNTVQIVISPRLSFLENFTSQIDFQLDCRGDSKSAEKWYTGIPPTERGDSLIFEVKRVLICPSYGASSGIEAHPAEGINLKIYSKDRKPTTQRLPLSKGAQNQRANTTLVCKVTVTPPPNQDIQGSCDVAQ